MSQACLALQNNLSLIAPVAWHPIDNAVITIDLSKDLSPLFELDVDALRERLYTKQIDLTVYELPRRLRRSSLMSPLASRTQSPSHRR